MSRGCTCLLLRMHFVAGRCSVLVKVTPDLSDLLVGHVTWWTFTSMTRIYKHYTFNLHGSQYKTHTTSMSSYPGMVTSMVRSTNSFYTPFTTADVQTSSL